MKTRSVLMFHGTLPKNEMTKLESFCDKQENGSFTYTGTLDNFEEKWGKHFLVWPTFICVTQHSSFGQR